MSFGMPEEHVLVTGGTGFTGGHLCRRLITDGYRVRSLVRDVKRSGDLTALGVEPIVGDLRDRASIARAVDGIDAVYHIAAVFRKENISNKAMWETNVQGTRNVLEASIRKGVRRFIHCSTVGVHGDIKRPPADEETPYNPEDHYQASKTAGERIVRQYMEDGRLPTVIYRPTGIYGPGDLRFLKLFRAVKKKRFAMIGSGEALYHMIYIDDLVDGILLCGTKPEALGRIFILAGEEVLTLNRLIEFIAKALGVPYPRLHLPFMPFYLAAFVFELLCKPFGIPPPLFRRRVNFFRKNRSFDISKSKKLLRFHPKIDIGTGIKRTAEWYRKQGML
jgi:nucleoside-diphosphate-sugar epimerase